MELIVTHSQTDFDALASQVAAHKLYPAALPLLNPQLSQRVHEFAALYRDALPFVSQTDLPGEPVTRLILVDTATPPHLPAALDPQSVLIIDHHPPSDSPASNQVVIYEPTGATTTILVRRLIDEQRTLTPIEATLLLLGIYEDTGSLSRPGTQQADVAAAAWLLGQGARIEAIGEFLRQPLSEAQDQIYHQLQENLRILDFDDRRVLIGAAHCSGSVPELSVLAELLRRRYEPTVIALVITLGDSGTQLILRSDGSALDVGAIARHFGGGGHGAAAAAFVRNQDATALLAELEAMIRARIKPPPSAADLMTAPVHVAFLGDTVAQAEARLDRFGHSALPVVDDAGVVQGLVARRDLVRARRHALRDAPVARYMWQRPLLVQPDTPIAAVRQALTTDTGERTGRVLVVDQDGKLQGIITRSDVLRALHPSTSGAHDVDDIRAALEQWLDPAALALERHAAAVAAALGASLYIVGGAVRDMLLNRQPTDLDLLVEGNAIAVAGALAAELGGIVHSHAQFGTATLELPDARTLDFVMARNEIYEHPSALPDVEAASLRHDLHRRDFTINTLAVCLNPERYGRLYDFYGGRRDLERRLIRVLHNLSFIDDPTRMLRAARLAARLGFSIEPRTRALIDDALEQGLLGRTTPARIMHELQLTLAEPEPQRCLQLLDELGILAQLHPALHWSAALEARFNAARLAAFPDTTLEQLYLGLLVYPLSDGEREALLVRYQPPRAIIKLLRDITALHQRLTAIQAANLTDSQLDQALADLGEPALRVAQLSEPEPVAGRIARYLAELRGITTELGGDFLRQLGLIPGPRFRELLRGLRAARLDGQVQTRAEEEAWLRERASREDNG